MAHRVAFRWIRLAKDFAALEIFDFDDTLVSSQGSVSVDKADGEHITMDSATFANYAPSEGDVLDFGAFNDVSNPRKIKKNFDRLREMSKKDGTKTIILTARAKGAEDAVTQFLASEGVTNVQVVSLASSDPYDKARWIDDAIAKYHPKSVNFFDDSKANAAAVAEYGDKHKDIEYHSTNVPHPKEADYDGKTIQKNFKSKSPTEAKVKYKPKPGSGQSSSNSKPSTGGGKSNWFEDQSDAFQKEYCGEHPASKYCGGKTAMNKRASDPMKAIRDRAKKVNNTKVTKYLGVLEEKLEMAGDHAGAFLEDLESNFDKLKPTGTFQGWKPNDFDDLYQTLYGVGNKKESHMNRKASMQPLMALHACLRAAHQAHWTAHWTTEGVTFYGDHLLFERLYSAIIGEIDGLAEKMVQAYGASSVDLATALSLMQGCVSRWSRQPDLHRKALMIEQDIQNAVENVKEALAPVNELSTGLENFLDQIADDHQTALYLLGQQQKGSKFASSGKVAKVYSIIHRHRSR